MIDQHTLDNMLVSAQVRAQNLWMKFQLERMAERINYPAPQMAQSQQQPPVDPAALAQRLGAIQAQRLQNIQAAHDAEIQKHLQGRGQSFNPAGGGQPHIQAAPGATRERLSGKDRLGNQLTEGL